MAALKLDYVIWGISKVRAGSACRGKIWGIGEKDAFYMIEPFKTPTEATEAEALAKYLTILKIQFIHIPNERKASPRFIHNLKKQGMKKGAPDYLIFLPNTMLAIELKRAKKSLSKVSPEQAKWIEYLDSLPYCTKAAVCYGFKEAKELIEATLKGGTNG